MPKRRPSLPRNHVSAQQVVAHNFRRAREEKSWTQAETSAQLEPYLGYALKQSGVSAIERTADDGVSRNLDIDELVAFASCFDKPMSWFLIPPVGWADQNVEALGPSMPGSHMPHTAAHLFRAAFGSDAGWESVRARLLELLAAGSDGERAHLGEAIDATFDLSPDEDLDLQLDLRREAMRETRLATFFSPRDAMVQKFAEHFVELVRVASPVGMAWLKDLSTEEALQVLAEGDQMVDGLGSDRKQGPLSSGNRFDDVRPIDPAEALEHARSSAESTDRES